jgi:virulence factor Mce-like protein
MRRGGSSVLANPVLVGAVTILVTLVAVFLAYNANNGLPFVPTTELKVQVPNGAELVPGNEVRTGGFRVGVVSDMRPVRLPDGTTASQLTLKLDKSTGKIPVDSSAVIRPRSALGLKYVELDLGHSRSTFKDGDTLPVTQTRVPVDLDQVLSMFDRKTREGAQTDLQGFGDAFAGRGDSLGQTIDELPRLLTHLQPVMHTLAARQTDLKDFFSSLDRAARAVAPVSQQQAHLFTTMANTFAAIGKDKPALKAFITKSPPTLDVSTDSLRVQRPFLHDFAGFSRDLASATHELRGALPDVNAAIDAGIPAQRHLVDTNTRLQGTMGALGELTEAPSTGGALRGLTDTVGTLNPQMRFYGPFQTVCDYWNYFWTYVAEHFSEEDSTGYSQRALINFAGQQDNSTGAMGAWAPANGENVKQGNAQFFHGPVYTAAIGPNGQADCEQGQRGYLYRDAKYAPSQFKIHVDPRSPGLQGPTFAGRPSVPPGETYTNIPETGPYKDIPAAETGDR